MYSVTFPHRQSNIEAQARGCVSPACAGKCAKYTGTARPAVLSPVFGRGTSLPREVRKLPSPGTGAQWEEAVVG